MRLSSSVFVPIFVGAALRSACHGFVPSIDRQPNKAHVHVSLSSTDDGTDEESSRAVDAVPVHLADVNPETNRLKNELLSLATSTQRGFRSSREEKERAERIINDLAATNPTEEPAASYYEDDGGWSADDGGGRPTLAGKWTLVYTDAPDITTLDAGPLSTAKLGRIGQECSPPTIKNVIEWRRPDWAASLPLSGSDGSRVLQKVVCEAKATPEDPFDVDLKLVGLDLVGSGESDNGMDSSSIGSGGDRGIVDRIQEGPAGLFRDNPIELRGPLKAPFGKFRILYLDDEMRIIKTGQNYFAVNVRDEEWF